MSVRRSLVRPPLASLLAVGLCLTPLAGMAAQEQPPPTEEAAAQEQPGPMDLFIAASRMQLSLAGFSRREAEVSGRRLVWWEKGEGEELVFVHGVNDQAGTWFQVAPKLAERFRVLLVDLPGHGESEPMEGPLRMTTVIEGFTEWLAERVDGGGEPPRLVGNSMGAWVALTVAHRRPELVGRVVAMNGGPLRAETGELDLLPDDREEARRLMASLRDPSNPPTPDVVLDDLVRRAPTSQVARMFAENDDLESYLLEAPALAEITVPTEILWGEADRYLGPDYPRRLLAALPDARLTLIEDCGHVPQVECPQSLLARLGEILAEEAPEKEKETETETGDVR